MSIQIPNLHTSNKSEVSFKAAAVVIDRRQDASHAGMFTINGSLMFGPANQYPTLNNLTIRVDLSDSAKGVVALKTVEQLDTTGKHTPTAYATGRCVVKNVFLCGWGLKARTLST